MCLLSREAAAELLKSQGVGSDKEVEDILMGFDFTRPVYEQEFWPGDVLYQRIRLPSFAHIAMETGSWFGLRGITNQGVAINDRLSGRQTFEFRVTAPFSALEGTAKELPPNIATGIGGRGGATQVYLPRVLLGRLEGMGARESW